MDDGRDDPVRSDPTIARLRGLLAERDPDALAAVDDVDRSLIVSTLRLDPWERFRASVANAIYLEELRKCLPNVSKR